MIPSQLSFDYGGRYENQAKKGDPINRDNPDWDLHGGDCRGVRSQVLTQCAGFRPHPATGGILTWENGVVGFDASVVITFSVTVTPGYEGIVSNTAVISDPMIAEPVPVMA